jgi:hypothetical protein
MKSDDVSFGIDRRTLVSGLALLPALSGLLSTPAQAQTWRCRRRQLQVNLKYTQPDP